MAAQQDTADSRPVFFFDIDNCVRQDRNAIVTRSSAKAPFGGFQIANSADVQLYSRKCNIHDTMQDLIDKFFVKHLSLSVKDATMLHQKYYREYGLAIEGLTRHHKIDPLEFNREVDDALPLDDILKPDPKLRKLLEDIDKTKVKLWLLTNAYVNHAKRVVRLLGVDDLFDGVTYCDYSKPPLVCKPNQDMYEKAEKEAGAPSTEQCYFVDDSHLNCRHAQARGWTTIHLVEPGFHEPKVPASKYQIRDLEELRGLFPQFFKSDSNQVTA